MTVGWVSLLCGLLWGWVSDHVGRKAALITAYLIQAVAFGLFALWPSPTGLTLSIDGGPAGFSERQRYDGGPGPGPPAGRLLRGQPPNWRRIASTRRRFVPRSLCPRRDAERTWITPAAGSSRSSTSSTKRSQRVRTSACR